MPDGPGACPPHPTAGSRVRASSVRSCDTSNSLSSYMRDNSRESQP